MLPVAHHFPFDAVPVEEIEAAAWVVVIMPERFQPRGNDLGFDCIEIIDGYADMVHRLALVERGISSPNLRVGIERDIGVICPDVDRVASLH